jgi:hypothetical protein
MMTINKKESGPNGSLLFLVSHNETERATSDYSAAGASTGASASAGASAASAQQAALSACWQQTAALSLQHSFSAHFLSQHLLPQLIAASATATIRSIFFIAKKKIKLNVVKKL